ncbi:unnamed protein product [Chrysoparadoxa australica]
MTKHRIEQVLAVLLQHSDRGVVYAAVGGLMNLGGDKQTRPLLWQEDMQVGWLLTGVLRSAGLADLEMATLACRALHNLLIEPQGGTMQILGGEKACLRLSSTLYELLGTAAELQQEETEEEAPGQCKAKHGAGAGSYGDIIVAGSALRDLIPSLEEDSNALPGHVTTPG